METSKIEIHRCDTHDHAVVILDGKVIISNDYSMENLTRLCTYLGIQVIDVTHSRDEFEKRFV